MASIFQLLLLLIFSWPLCCLCQRGTFTLDIHHRFSDEVRRWTESTSMETTRNVWPEKGSLHYYASLYEHDMALLGRRRGLAGDRPLITFEDGNKTLRLNSLGFLHYAFISLGTPGVKFLIALDTGSSLLWVPCSDCTSCSPTSNADYNLKFNFYNSSLSPTSKKVLCSNNLCERQVLCTNPSDPCPYEIRYLDGSSTSGVLVEDLLHLITENTDHHQAVNVNVTFGCGQNQDSVDPLDPGIPNGILGLGTKNVSVPSILASKGHVADSFSMCFGLHDPNGTISFGDKGSTDQKETPLVPIAVSGHYVVNVTGIQVKERTSNSSFYAIVDTGCSFSYLADPVYTNIATAFDSQVLQPPHPRIPELPFEYCYKLSPGQTSILLPKIMLTMEGGSQFDILNPILGIMLNGTDSMYCLAIIKSQSETIIGQNFMQGYRLVFDRERHILGWKEFNCYSVENQTLSYGNPKNYSVIPPPSLKKPTKSSPPSQQKNKACPSSSLGLSLLFYTIIVVGLFLPMQ